MGFKPEKLLEPAGPQGNEFSLFQAGIRITMMTMMCELITASQESTHTKGMFTGVKTMM